ncbi:unnamed protein product [Microthlaspi erraticum]|uniref:Arabidopsis retrotransposon Orf1 C-terminal domain-containing protein n=1 Tax=Microthlaspi erraticum TaxID=1685480 RepID=A0A6D2JPZ7_9BRAS|nr:unnamed protein product [Microthlaspi erraticum]
MNLWRRLSHKSKRRRELPMYQEHYNALFSMDFMETKYPHVDTMKALGIFEDVELVSRTCTWPSSSLITWNPTRSSLASSSFNEAAWNLVWVQLWRGTKWNFKEKELQRVWATIADGVYSSSRSKAAQIRSPVLRYVHKALANTFFARKATGTINEGELKFLDMGIKPISHAQGWQEDQGEIDHTGNLMPSLTISSPTRSQPTTLGIKRKALSVGGLITPSEESH